MHTYIYMLFLKYAYIHTNMLIYIYIQHMERANQFTYDNGANKEKLNKEGVFTYIDGTNIYFGSVMCLQVYLLPCHIDTHTMFICIHTHIYTYVYIYIFRFTHL